METSKSRISSRDTKIAYIDYENLTRPESQIEAIESLKTMRFLVIKNVPGVREMQEKIYQDIKQLPRMCAENPHSPSETYFNRTTIDSTFKEKEDGTYDLKATE